MKRIISLMLTLAVALSLLILPAGAASTPEEALGEVNIYSGGYSMNYLAVNGRVQTQSYTYFLYRNSVGETQEIPAYCAVSYTHLDVYKRQPQEGAPPAGGLRRQRRGDPGPGRRVRTPAGVQRHRRGSGQPVPLCPGCLLYTSRCV